MTGTKRAHVFLCHASEDKFAVRKFYDRLKTDGIDAWLDEEELLPGQDWQFEISKAVKASDAIIVFLSSQSVRKVGFVQKEIKLALDVAREKPEGTIYFIPARLDECVVPDSLQSYQWVNLFDDKGYERLKRALKTRIDFTEREALSFSDTVIIANSRLTQITIILEKDILKFTEKEKDGFVFAISKLTGVSPNQIRILQVAEGSIVITLEMPEIGAKKLLELYNKNDIEVERLGISKVILRMDLKEKKEPEQLPSAPRFNRRDAFAFLVEARDEPNPVQWVLSRNLISKAGGWFTDMVGKQASLRMTAQQVGDYMQGFLLPLLCLQAARLSVNEGKENYLRTAGEWEENPGLIFAMQNLDTLIRLMNDDPSGKMLMQEMATTGAEDFPDPYFVKGLNYAKEVYGEYMDFFFNYRDQVELW